MTLWKIKFLEKNVKLNNPILIEGLPGIGNVGKVAVDFIIEEVGAKKLCEFTSHTFPHSVFVNEKNLVELPSISLYYKKFNSKKKKDLLLLAGDVQPIDEESCYAFSEHVLDLLVKFKAKELVTLGGIGLQNVPKNPRVYCTGNSKSFIKNFIKGTKVSENLYGIVGPIVGVSGLLLGLATERKIKSISFLAETFGHPMYLGVKGARSILRVLSLKLDIKVNLKALDKEIEELEREMLKKTKELSDVTKRTAIKKLRGKIGKETSYIG